MRGRNQGQWRRLTATASPWFLVKGENQVVREVSSTKERLPSIALLNGPRTDQQGHLSTLFRSPRPKSAYPMMLLVGHVFMTSSLVCLLLSLVILPVASNECSVPPPPPASFWRLESKTALVTGGTKGIGENTIAARYRNLHANLISPTCPLQSE